MVASRQMRVTRMILALGLVLGSRQAQTSLLAQNPTAEALLLNPRTHSRFRISRLGFASD